MWVCPIHENNPDKDVIMWTQLIWYAELILKTPDLCDVMGRTIVGYLTLFTTKHILIPCG